MDVAHLTINTGHVATTSRGDVADNVIELLRPIYQEAKVRPRGMAVGQVPGGGVPLEVVVWPGLMRDMRQIKALGVAAFQIALVPRSASERSRAGIASAPAVVGVVCGADPHSVEAWAMVDFLLRMAIPLPELRPRLGLRPESTPWLAVVLGVPVLAGMLKPETVALLGDLERCLAWTMLEDDGLFAPVRFTE